MSFEETPVESTMALGAHIAADDSSPVRLNPQDQAAIEALALGDALLIAHHGPNAGARFLLDVDVVSAGRSVSCDIFLDDVTVSREHANFVRSAGTYVVADAGSLNGTYVNRERVIEAKLAPGDEVQIGKYRLTYYPGIEH